MNMLQTGDAGLVQKAKKHGACQPLARGFLAIGAPAGRSCTIAVHQEAARRIARCSGKAPSTRPLARAVRIRAAGAGDLCTRKGGHSTNVTSRHALVTLLQFFCMLMFHKFFFMGICCVQQTVRNLGLAFPERARSPIHKVMHSSAP